MYHRKYNKLSHLTQQRARWHFDFEIQDFHYFQSPEQSVGNSADITKKTHPLKSECEIQPAYCRWCRWPDLNRYEFVVRGILSPLCLPIPPHRQITFYILLHTNQIVKRLIKKIRGFFMTALQFPLFLHAFPCTYRLCISYLLV